jgi:hypothetical protein
LKLTFGDLLLLALEALIVVTVSLEECLDL